MEALFPMCLMAEVTAEAKAANVTLTDWVRRHNNTVRSYSMRMTGHLSSQEHAILSLAEGIDHWIARSGHADDGLLGMEVTYPLLKAFIAALGGETGRLDCGTLGNWAEERLKGLGISPDGEWLPDPPTCLNCGQPLFKYVDLWKHETGKQKCDPELVREDFTPSDDFEGRSRS
jgi:hypothetical protein